MFVFYIKTNYQISYPTHTTQSIYHIHHVPTCCFVWGYSNVNLLISNYREHLMDFYKNPYALMFFLIKIFIIFLTFSSHFLTNSLFPANFKIILVVYVIVNSTSHFLLPEQEYDNNSFSQVRIEPTTVVFVRVQALHSATMFWINMDD